MSFPKANTKQKILKNDLTKATVLVVLFLFFFGMIPTKPLYAETSQDYQNQLNQIDKQLSQNANQQHSLNEEINAINTQIKSVQLQINQTTDQIATLDSKITDLNSRISETEANLKKQKIILGEYLKQMYMDGQTSTLELIVASNNLSDFVDKSEYLNTMQQHIQDTANKIATLKADLDKQKNDLEISRSQAESLKTSQIAQKNAIVDQQNYKNTLLASAKSTASQLSKQKQDIYEKMIESEESYGNTAFSGSSSYPWGNPPNNPDSLDGQGYYVGECTSYAAWKRKTIGKPIPPAIGNGGQWIGENAGYPQSNIPKAGDVMVFPSWSVGGVGHVAYVEAVNSNGTVLISQYNWPVWFNSEVPFSVYYPSKGMWYGKFRYSTMTVNPYDYGAWFIH